MRETQRRSAAVNRLSMSRAEYVDGVEWMEVDGENDSEGIKFLWGLSERQAGAP